MTHPDAAFWYGLFVLNGLFAISLFISATDYFSFGLAALGAVASAVSLDAGDEARTF